MGRGEERSSAPSRDSVGPRLHRRFFPRSVRTNEGAASPMRWTDWAKRGSERREVNYPWA
jgi:hypothetical protein